MFIAAGLVLSIACDASRHQTCAVDESGQQCRGVQLASSPGIWRFDDFLSEGQVSYLVARMGECEWGPCEGSAHVHIELKQCGHVPVGEDPNLLAILAQIEAVWGADTSQVTSLPVVRYKPGAPSTLLHVDHYVGGTTPDASMLFYLSTTPGGVAQTLFPTLGLAVQPVAGTLLSWLNHERGTGALHPDAAHAVDAYPADAEGDRLAMQIPVQLRSAGGEVEAWYEPLVAARPGGNRTAHGLHARIATTGWVADFNAVQKIADIYGIISSLRATNNPADEINPPETLSEWNSWCDRIGCGGVADRRLLFAAQLPCPKGCVP
mmetsp:Transcript_7376/g.21539  ORF Transcript_7376/g.21539 Transcript_7376/m.21539 type:complete len:321 (+) Transcript_7376:105-1067(+)